MERCPLQPHFASFIRPGTPLHLPGAPFLLAALLLVVALVLTWYVTNRRMS